MPWTAQSRNSIEGQNMKTNSIAAAVAMIAGTALPAHAETVAYSANPIKVVTYSVTAQQHDVATSPWGGSMAAVVPGNVRISFQNLRLQPISNVRFIVRSKNDREVIVDKGTFSQGATITHDFSVDSGLDEAADLEVDQVTFADGAVWNRDATAQ